jgi:hypothetical protein
VIRVRLRRHFGPSSVAVIARDHDNRVKATSDWLTLTNFDPAKCGTMRMTSQEVQTILNFDERVHFVSTDGRVWPVGVTGLFHPDGTIDGARWIATLKPNVLQERPVAPDLSGTLDACTRGAAAACAFADVSWVYQARANAWVDIRCLR